MITFKSVLNHTVAAGCNTASRLQPITLAIWGVMFFVCLSFVLSECYVKSKAFSLNNSIIYGRYCR